jgi:hypothetical protein
MMSNENCVVHFWNTHAVASLCTHAVASLCVLTAQEVHINIQVFFIHMQSLKRSSVPFQTSSLLLMLWYGTNTN